MSERAHFTPFMNEMVDIAGLSVSAVRLLARAKGGTRITVPKTAKSKHWITNLIGMENAEKLCSYFCGEEIEMPMGPFTHTALKHEAIRRLDREGKKYNEIASLTGVTRRTAMRAVKGCRTGIQNSAQSDMFPDHHPRPRNQKRLPK
ncbi:MAG: hypothetical protein JKY10_11220 [Cohaesibacteraceae bacterium]|nr:hypothetical protein [Cohaesibacteraceae bacterium]